jgi:hypothetical protein
MNRLALGTVQFGLPYGIANQAGQVTISEVSAMLKLASDSIHFAGFMIFHRKRIMPGMAACTLQFRLFCGKLACNRCFA